MVYLFPNCNLFRNKWFFDSILFYLTWGIFGRKAKWWIKQLKSCPTCWWRKAFVAEFRNLLRSFWCRSRSDISLMHSLPSSPSRSWAGQRPIPIFIHITMYLGNFDFEILCIQGDARVFFCEVCQLVRAGLQQSCFVFDRERTAGKSVVSGVTSGYVARPIAAGSRTFPVSKRGNGLTTKSNKIFYSNQI